MSQQDNIAAKQRLGEAVNRHPVSPRTRTKPQPNINAQPQNLNSSEIKSRVRAC
jgi:hypothetical protein